MSMANRRRARSRFRAPHEPEGPPRGRIPERTARRYSNEHRRLPGGRATRSPLVSVVTPRHVAWAPAGSSVDARESAPYPQGTEAADAEFWTGGNQVRVAAASSRGPVHQV